MRQADRYSEGTLPGAEDDAHRGLELRKRDNMKDDAKRRDTRNAREARERSEVSAGTDARDAREAQAQSEVKIGRAHV